MTSVADGPTVPTDVLAGAAFHPVPDRAGHVVERLWDGDVWTDDRRPATPEETLPAYRRRVWHFLRTPGWALTLVFLVSTGVCLALVAQDPHATRPSGVTWLLPPLALLASVSMMVGVGVFFDRRLAASRLPQVRAAVAWGVLSGAVAVGVALLFEVGLPALFHADGDAHGWSLIAGPAEESAKLAIPVVLWFTGRFRLPRQGFVLVVTSAATFGMLEAARYGLSPDDFQPGRTGGEILHVVFTGFVAAVAWQAAWKGRTWFTAAGMAAVVAAMALHSANDYLVLGKFGVLSSLATPTAVVVSYLLLKHSARQMVPPDRVATVSPRWRPVAEPLGTDA